MIDEAFMPLHRHIEELASLDGSLADEEHGVRSYIYECQIDSPVELDVVRDEQGVVRLGSTPPLYYVDTSIRPVFHRLRLTVRGSEVSDGG